MRVIDIQSARFKTQFPKAWESPNFSPELSLVPKAQTIVPAGPLVAIFLCIFQGYEAMNPFYVERADVFIVPGHDDVKVVFSDGTYEQGYVR